MHKSLTTAAAHACVGMALAGCQPLAMTALGVGASTGISHTINGVAYRTFTVPEPRLRSATLAALNRMGIKIDSTEKVETGQLIKAHSDNRRFEIALETITASTTRMRTTAKNGAVFYDSATATELILQTEKALSRS
jgi:hypothetical protein